MKTEQLPDTNKQNAKLFYYEPEARFRVSLQWTRLIAAAQGIALVIAVLVIAGQIKSSGQTKIEILAQSSNGALVPVSYLDASVYRPDEKVLEHFAIQFVMKHYSRNKYTIGKDYLDSLLFFDPDKRKEELAREKREKWIEEFQKDPTAREVRIAVTKIRRGTCDQDSKCQISIDFDKHFILRGIEQPNKTENWTVQLTYTFLPKGSIDDDMVIVNPIGLSIGDTQETKGFRDDSNN